MHYIQNIQSVKCVPPISPPHVQAGRAGSRLAQGMTENLVTAKEAYEVHRRILARNR